MAFIPNAAQFFEEHKDEPTVQCLVAFLGRMQINDETRPLSDVTNVTVDFTHPHQDARFRVLYKDGIGFIGKMKYNPFEDQWIIWTYNITMTAFSGETPRISVKAITLKA